MITIKKVMLFCAAGMSTSLLVTKMRNAAAEKNLDVSIEAHGVSQLEDRGKEADVILLGPQIRYLLKKARGLYPDKPVEVIDMRAYGMIDGEKVIESVMEWLQEE